MVPFSIKLEWGSSGPHRAMQVGLSLHPAFLNLVKARAVTDIGLLLELLLQLLPSLFEYVQQRVVHKKTSY